MTISRKLRHSSALVRSLATGLVVAGPVLLPASASAQSRPYSHSGAYENVTDTDVTAGTGNFNYDAQRQYDEIGQKDVTSTGISPDVLRPAERPIDTTEIDAASRAVELQRQAELRRRKSNRQSERIYQDYRNEGRKLWIKPYLEVSQIVEAQLAPTSNAFTWTVLAAGVDAGTAGPNYQGSLSARYERRIGYGSAQSFDNVSAVGRGIAAIVPDLLHFEVAGYANRTHVEGSGATAGNLVDNGSSTQIYTVMAGPSLATDAGDLEIKGHYRIGYAHVGNPSIIPAPAGQDRADIFDHSTIHDAKARVGLRPGDSTPVGVAVEGGYYQENISNLDQHARDGHIRGEVIVPVTEDTALVGGLGYEWVRVDSRDAVRDSAGNPVVNAKGRLQTDYAGPRYIAFDTEGLIWDAGVIWRPSPKTNLEAHVGRRYGEFGGYGTFSYRPTARSSVNVLVYNNMAGFGGMMTTSLGNLPTQFIAVRDSLTGNIGACVNSGSGGNCLTGALATVRSTVFRGRGVSATYNWAWSRYQAGIGAGYDHRRYIAAPGTTLGALDGKAENYTWIAGYLNTRLDRDSVLTTTLDAYRFTSDVPLTDDFNAVRATVIYQHQFSRHLSGSAAVGIDTINREALDDVWNLSGQVGMRYTF